MTNRTQPALVKLGDTDLTVADAAEDIRGHTVVDQQGEDIGTVEGLMIDEDERKVRFLRVAAGGFLGIGEKTFLIPVDAVSRIEGDQVHVDRTRDHITGGPSYDPDLAEQTDIWESSYGYYGYT
ncbi:MAG: PRC-barrel domain-containing protein, partial [Chloroflexia bacterium]|nr:PRC-barrel domain-containing protein [Chloroflexia bacterium]